jgi:Na+/H+ antiporter NhaD/arsenite permease-like protein
LFFGSLLAGWIGTTGAATLLIRPFLRANAERKYKTHIVMFFIFLTANIGGAATPLGDPPLFIGFLEGIDFFWFFKNLYPYIFSVLFGLCFVFFVIDTILFRSDPGVAFNRDDEPVFVLHGVGNILLIAGILVAVIGCNFPGEFVFCGERCRYSSLLRNIVIAGAALISLKITPAEIRMKNAFSFAPIREVAELFVGIFITVTPIIDMLHRGSAGPLKCIFDWAAPGGIFAADRCFWAAGVLSSILDNAPTFLIFFHMTSGNAAELMTAKAHILTAISAASVFMGALTYIGNAPNLMVKSISIDYGVKMPSFIGYLLWSCGILLPVFWIVARFL